MGNMNNKIAHIHGLKKQETCLNQDIDKIDRQMEDINSQIRALQEKAKDLGAKRVKLSMSAQMALANALDAERELYREFGAQERFKNATSEDIRQAYEEVRRKLPEL